MFVVDSTTTVNSFGPSSEPAVSPVQAISASALTERVRAHYSSSLPPSAVVFPYLHGLHHTNNVQAQYFFSHAASKSEAEAIASCKPPPIRTLLLVHVGKLELASRYVWDCVMPKDILQTTGGYFGPSFAPVFTPPGISVRNFDAQIALSARLADIVVYAATPHDAEEAQRVATMIRLAQHKFKHKHVSASDHCTFLYQGTLDELERAGLDRIGSNELTTEYNPNMPPLRNQLHKRWNKNMCVLERAGIHEMSKAIRIDIPVAPFWLGNAKDYRQYHHQPGWMTFVKCVEHVSTPALRLLDRHIRDTLRSSRRGSAVYSSPDSEVQSPRDAISSPVTLEFPASGMLYPQGIAKADILAIISMLKLIYVRSKNSPNTLVVCSDGYRGSTLLVLLYLMYATGIHLRQALVDLHHRHKRYFVCGASDIKVALLLQQSILSYSPALETSMYTSDIGALSHENAIYMGLEPRLNDGWLSQFDGTIPSRILNYLYLGSMRHASNPHMLVDFGIKRMLCVGENPSWVPDEPGLYENLHEGIDQVLVVKGVLDNGIDSIEPLLDQCIEYIEDCFQTNTTVMVHCHAGVSRSAAVCIAEVMKRLNCSLPQAYMYVRLHRLSVIIQPNLRFMYELSSWEKRLADRAPRLVDWHALCQEIADLNRMYN